MSRIDAPIASTAGVATGELANLGMRHTRFLGRISHQTAKRGRGDVCIRKANTAELVRAVDWFASMFELVFDGDWPTTETNMAPSARFIDRRGTFIRPRVKDESNNWANRGALLGAYRHLLQCMEDCGVQREELW